MQKRPSKRLGGAAYLQKKTKLNAEKRPIKMQKKYQLECRKDQAKGGVALYICPAQKAHQCGEQDAPPMQKKTM